MAHSRWRPAAKAGAAAVAALISIGFAALPAQASDGGNLFLVVAPDAQTLLPQSAGANADTYRTITPMVVAEDNPLTGVTIAVDAAKLAGVAQLSLPAGCAFTSPDDLHASCTVGSVALMAGVKLGIRAAAGAVSGATGSLSFKVTATNGVEDTGPGSTLGGPAGDSSPAPSASPGAEDTTQVTIGDGADLAVQQLGAFTVKAGQSTTFVPQVSNLGDRDADGVVMFVGTTSAADPIGFGIGGNYSNCRYGVSDGSDSSGPGSADPSEYGVLCRFDTTVVKPGEVMVPSAPMVATSTPQATNGDLIYGYDVTGGLLDQGTSGGVKGTGPALTLVDAPVATAKSPSASVDIDYDNNSTFSPISTQNVDDVAAIGGTFDGTVGHSRSVTVGLKNVGTTPTKTMQGAPSANDTAALLALFPDGVDVTAAPKACQYVDLNADARSSALTPGLRSALAGRTQVLDDGGPGTVYVCVVDRVVKPGQTVDFGFTVKPTRVLKAVQGIVVAESQSDDATPDNNIADMTFNAVKGAASPGASPKASAPATPSPAATASSAPSTIPGGLAHTGGGDDSLPLVGVGAVAVLIGAGALFATRRRRSAGRG